MIDRQKVIKGLQELHGSQETMSLISDVITLLKEDCHNCKLECLLQKYDQLKEKYDKLLKEQEAVEPVTESSVYDQDTWFFVCGSCKKGVISPGDNFCRWCGKRIEWEGR